MKKEKPVIDPQARRSFVMKLGKASATLVFSGAILNKTLGRAIRQTPGPGQGTRWSSANPLPNANDPVQAVPGTRPELTPLEDHYKMIHFGIPKEPDLDTWRLRFDGLVERPIDLSYDDIRQFEPIHEFITLTCITNPVGGGLSGTTRWTGVSMQKILPLLELKNNATHLRIGCADAFFETVAVETILSDERVMLAYLWDGVPLPMAHGYPLRIYIPNRYGMKLPKWITSFTAMDHWEPGYSVKNTWDKEALMKTTSVIDSLHVEGDDIHIGGIAHGGSNGISKVEVQVDGGTWQTALLRKPLSQLSWVIWRFTWPFSEGQHEFAVRAYNRKGQLQEIETTGAYPDGASGVFRKSKTF